MLKNAGAAMNALVEVIRAPTHMLRLKRAGGWDRIVRNVCIRLLFVRVEMVVPVVTAGIRMGEGAIKTLLVVRHREGYHHLS